MPSLERAVMLGLALFVAWTMLRAWRTGTVFDRGWSYNVDERPIMFVLVMIGHGLLIAFCLWLAAGYDAAGFLRLIGLGWLPASWPLPAR